MDFVYSNSLDHSCCPEVTLQTWLQQTKPTGFLTVRWGVRETRVKRGDCFSCTQQELIDMINKIGIVRDVIPFMQSRKNTYVLLFCQKKDA